jgi:hypothetical protein
MVTVRRDTSVSVQSEKVLVRISSGLIEMVWAGTVKVKNVEQQILGEFAMEQSVPSSFEFTFAVPNAEVVATGAGVRVGGVDHRPCSTIARLGTEARAVMEASAFHLTVTSSDAVIRASGFLKVKPVRELSR